MKQEIRDGIETAFIDRNYNSNLAYRPQFISNDYKNGRKVLSSLEYELKNCDEFFISVAFITDGGIAPLLLTLKELEERGIRGKILTANYLMFSNPKSLDKLASFNNIELKMYYIESDNDPGFHTKGYMFRKDGIYRMIVGSSNMTRIALTSNKEWNTKVVSTEQGEYATELLGEFQKLWNASNSKAYAEVIENYRIE